MSPSQSDTFADLFFSQQSATWADRYRSPSYAQRRQLIAEIVRKEVLRLNRPAPTIKLLDFGSGSGVILRDSAELGLQVTGVDNSQAMIDAARKHLSGFGKQVNLEWLQNASGEGKYEKESYDIVLCVSVLEFVPDIHSLLLRIWARVASGGMLVVSVPNRRSWLRTIEKFINRHPQMFQRLSTLDHLTGSDSYLNHQAHQLTRRELSDIGRGQGLREEAHRFHAAPPLLQGFDRLEQVGMMLMMIFRN